MSPSVIVQYFMHDVYLYFLRKKIENLKLTVLLQKICKFCFLVTLCDQMQRHEQASAAQIT